MNKLLSDYKKYTQMVKKCCLLFFLYLMEASSVCATETLHTADKLDLSNSAIICMHQDNSGYMWFGTYDGLNLYNGKNTFVYRAELDKDYTLCSNIIHNIIQCDSNHLWVSTFLGLNKFSLRERKVTESYPELPEATIIASDNWGETWVICKKNYISHYIAKEKVFMDIYYSGVDETNVKVMFFNNNGKLCLVTADGKLKNITIAHDPANIDIQLQTTELILHERGIISAFQEHDHVFFVTEDYELFRYNLPDNSQTFISNLSHLKEEFGRISTIVTFRSDIFLSFNDNGVIKLDMENNYHIEPVYLGVRTFCLYKDKNQDILWMGTDGKGVQMYYQKDELFGNITFDNTAFGTQKPVRAIYTDDEENLWIGIKGDGIMRIKKYTDYNQETISLPQMVNYTTHNGLSNNNVYCFLRSKKPDILWIGTDGPGFSYYSYKDNVVRTLPGKAGEQIGKVHSICEVNDSTLWMATAGQGLLEVSLEKKSSLPAIRSVNEYILKKGNRTCQEFHSMFYDGDSILYIGSRGGTGVIRYNTRKKQYEFIRMKNTENSAIGDVLCVYQGTDSTFYVGASSGLTCIQYLKKEEQIVKQFDRRNGIINDMIHGILEDSDGCIWLSTNKGLIKYNPHNDFFHNYSDPDLKVTEFSDDAYWKCRETGRLFFGGVNGLTWLEAKETEAQGSYYKPELHFFDLQIGGESFALYDYLNEKESIIEIGANISSFTISFAAIDYINGDNYEYSYILENYHEEWTELQKTNEVTFTNLPHGDYQLKVKYKNDVFDSDENFYTLSIRKLPPWYQTTWAYLLYVILFLGFLAYVVYVIRKRIIDRQMQIAQKIKEEQKDKLLQSKLNFFTNVTHEFCTPLTVIKGVSEYIEKSAETNEYLKKYMVVLRDNVDNLNSLIQEILDFRRLKEGKQDFSNIECVSVSELIEKQVKWFVPIAEQNNIRLEVLAPEGLNWNTNVLGFNRVFVNLISNAFKYTTNGGEVKVSIAENNGLLILKVYNTGQGIEKSKMASVFDRYRVLEDMEVNNAYSSITSRNGLGLSICHEIVELLNGNIRVESEVNNYAEFIVKLPLLEITGVKTEHTQVINPPVKENFVLTDVAKHDKKVVLVVDDNKDIVWLITNTLSDVYIVKNAYNAEDALHVIETEAPALIITDIMMPNVDGLEFIKQLKADKFMKHIPIVVVSAKISEQDQAEGLDIGADAYLTKPFSSAVLRSVINRLLTVKDELKEYYYSPESAYEYTEGQPMHQEDKAFMDSIIKIISENLEDENLRPEFIAEKLNTNTRNLYRRFKKQTNLSPSDFIKDYRFISAAKLLITTNLTIQEIIYKVGITNKSYFYREFLKKYNMTPKEYRSQR